MKIRATEIEQEQKLLKAQLELHQRKAEAARKSLQTATKNCQQCDYIHCADIWLAKDFANAIIINWNLLL